MWRKQAAVGYRRQLAGSEPALGSYAPIPAWSATSAASVALAHGVNANLLLRWRREYEMGAFGAVSQAAFVPVELSVAAQTLEPAPSPQIGRAHV